VGETPTAGTSYF